jgi:hypothetical protein
LGGAGFVGVAEGDLRPGRLGGSGGAFLCHCAL